MNVRRESRNVVEILILSLRVAVETMKPGSEKILARAAVALQRAEEHLNAGLAERASERAYHAIVHSGRAVLNERGERARSHQEVCDKLTNRAPPNAAALVEALGQALRWRRDVEELVPGDDDELVSAARIAVAQARELAQSE